MRFKKSQKLVALLLIVLFSTSILTVGYGATSTDFPLEITIGANVYRFATHTSSKEGNWVKLWGGSDITLPQLTLQYNGISSADYTKDANVQVGTDASFIGDAITYPYSTHPLFAAGGTVNFAFKGKTSLAGQPVECRIIKVNDPLDYESAMSDMFRGTPGTLETLLDTEYKASVDGLLNATGDITGSWGAVAAGDYIIVVMSDVGSTWTIYGATAVEVLDGGLTSTLPAATIREGLDLDIDMTLAVADTGNHVYGAIMIKESAYQATALMTSSGSIASTEVTVNGATLIDGGTDSFSLFAGGFGGLDEDAIMDFMGQAFSSNEWAAAFSTGTAATTYTLSVDTNGLAEDDYVVLTGVWDNSADISTGDRLLGFDQDSVFVDYVSSGGSYVPPPGGGGLVTTPTQDEFDEQTPEEQVETIDGLDTEDAVELLEGASTEDAAQVLEKLDDDKAAELLEAMDETKAQEIIDAMQTEAASQALTKTSAQKATQLLTQTETSKAAQIVEKMSTETTKNLVEEAVTTSKTTQMATILNTVNKETVGDVLLSVQPETGAKVIREMATQDLNGAAERVEAAVKRQISSLDPEQKQQYRQKLKETIENPELSVDDLVNLFTEIANLPETPSTVAEIFEIIDLSKTVEVVDGMVAKDKESETALVFSYLSTEKLTEIYSALTAATRTAIYPYFDAETLGNLPQLGEFTVTSLSVSPETVEPGESVTVTAEVENIGDETDSTTITLSVDGTEIESMILTLDSDGAETLMWTVSETGEGLHTVEVMGETAIFIVQAPPTPAEFSLSNLQVSPSTVESGEDVTVSFTVMNTGEESGDYSVDVLLDGAAVDTLTGTLDGGDSESLTAIVSSDVEGTHTVAVDGLDADFSVEVPPSGFPWTYVIVAVVIIAAAAYIYMQQQKQ